MAAAALVDVYVGHRRVRAEIPLQGFGRVSDLFNSFGGSFGGKFMAGSVRMITSLSDPAGGAVETARGDVVFRVQDVLLVRPLDEPPGGPGSTGPVSDRLLVPVAMEVNGWQITGELYLPDKIPWIDFMETADERFLAVGNALVQFAESAAPLDCSFLLVNGRRVSVLYEVSAP